LIVDISLDKKVRIAVWKLSGSGSGLRIRTGFALAEICALRVLLFCLYHANSGTSLDDSHLSSVYILFRAWFTPSGAPVQKNVGARIIWIPLPRLPSPDTHSSHNPFLCIAPWSPKIQRRWWRQV